MVVVVGYCVTMSGGGGVVWGAIRYGGVWGGDWQADGGLVVASDA